MRKDSWHQWLFTCCILGFVACSGKVDPTSVVVEDPVRHYYPISAGDELWISYELTNTGKNPLIISEIQTSCGCILYDDSKSIIPPGNKEQLLFKYDSFKNIGYVHHQIRLYGNFESRSMMLLEFDVNVVPASDYVRDYEEIYFGKIQAKKKHAIMKSEINNKDIYYVDNDY